MGACLIFSAGTPVHSVGHMSKKEYRFAFRWVRPLASKVGSQLELGNGYRPHVAPTGYEAGLEPSVSRAYGEP